jgi:ureidoglycolate lyase
MREIKARELTMEGFAPYGTFANMIDPPEAVEGRGPVAFIPDMAQLNLGQTGIASFSVCRVLKRPNVVDTVEMHRSCGEGILPLDADILIHVGRPTFNGMVPLDTLEAFRVPKGTFVALRRGVWHFAPYALNGDVANVVIVLPERTYADDCYVYPMPEDKQVKINL